MEIHCPWVLELRMTQKMTHYSIPMVDLDQMSLEIHPMELDKPQEFFQPLPLDLTQSLDLELHLPMPFVLHQRLFCPLPQNRPKTNPKNVQNQPIAPQNRFHAQFLFPNQEVNVHQKSNVSLGQRKVRKARTVPDSVPPFVHLSPKVVSCLKAKMGASNQELVFPKIVSINSAEK